MKQFQHDSEEAYEKSKITLRLREDALKKARESCLRTESSPPEREASRRRRDLEKTNRAVEEAMIKVRFVFDLEQKGLLKTFEYLAYRSYVNAW